MSEPLQVLPIDEHLSRISAALERAPILVLTSSPGSGKTTRVPVRLSQDYGKTLVLEPRRIAAIAAAQRVASESGSALGSEVGYQVRLEKKWQASTKILFLTNALLHNFVLRDRNLADTQVIVIDEFHERSWQTDFALALALNLLKKRPNLKIVLMSATLSASKLMERFAQLKLPAEWIDIDSKPFPLNVSYDQKPQSFVFDQKFAERLVGKINQAVVQSDLNVLVFLPGVPEIKRVARLLESSPLKSRKIEILELHGSLSLEEQKRVLERTTGRIVLSTNIAESSLTIPNVDVVVDSGMEKTIVHEKASPFADLKLQKISLFSAHQRAGRAAREKEGVCLRMWTEADERTFVDEIQPELSKALPPELVIQCCVLGWHRVGDLDWIEEPDPLYWQQALATLQRLGFLGQDAQITKSGRALAALPLDVSVGLVFLKMAEKGRAPLGAVLATLLQDGEPAHLRGNSNRGSTSMYSGADKISFVDRLDRLAVHNRRQPHDRWFQAAQQLSPQLGFEWTELDTLVLLDVLLPQVGRWREKNSDRGLLFSGMGVMLERNEKRSEGDFFICLKAISGLNPAEALMSWHVPVAKEMIIERFAKDFTETVTCVFDCELESFVEMRNKSWGPLAIDTLQKRRISQSELPRDLSDDETKSLQADLWEFLKLHNASLASFVARYKWFLEVGELDESLPAMADFIELRDVWSEELTLTIWNSGLNIKELLEINFEPWLQELFSAYLFAQFQQNLPKEIRHGQRCFKVDYGSAVPKIEAKLQDFFGMRTHPKVLDGNVAIQVVMLGPHRRPVQITADIMNFWKGSYADVRKDLRARYPKHAWPVDPLADLPPR